MSRTIRRGVSYEKIWPTTLAVSLDLLAEMSLVLIWKRTHPPLKQHVTWTRTTQRPTLRTHTHHCMQVDPRYNEMVADESSYALITRLLRRTHKTNACWIIIPKPGGYLSGAYYVLLIVKRLVRGAYHVVFITWRLLHGAHYDT